MFVKRGGKWKARTERRRRLSNVLGTLPFLSSPPYSSATLCRPPLPLFLPSSPAQAVLSLCLISRPARQCVELAHHLSPPRSAQTLHPPAPSPTPKPPPAREKLVLGRACLEIARPARRETLALHTESARLWIPSHCCASSAASPSSFFSPPFECARRQKRSRLANGTLRGVTEQTDPVVPRRQCS